MGKIKDRSGSIQTVGDLKKCLAKFPDDMPLKRELCEAIQIYRDGPIKGETRYDLKRRGRLRIHQSDYES